jgi:hypothetical protein
MLQNVELYIYTYKYILIYMKVSQNSWVFQEIQENTLESAYGLGNNVMKLSIDWPNLIR